jgi:hypothetical protein
VPSFYACALCPACSLLWRTAAWGGLYAFFFWTLERKRLKKTLSLASASASLGWFSVYYKYTYLLY